MGGRHVREENDRPNQGTAKVDDVMVVQVMCASPGQTVGHVREVMNQHGIHCMPVTEADAPAGIVTATDLLKVDDERTRISEVMTRKVFTVPRYADPSLAARVMRNHRIHHVVVTHEQKVVGILSSFDLLALVENRRFTAKNAPTPSKAKGSRKKTEEP